MAKTILIVDKNLIGASKENRPRGWSLSTNELRGHPMVSRLPNDRVDYFRRLMARYYSFTDGTHPGNYDNFEYILPSTEFEPDEQASESRNVAFSLAHFGEANYTVPSYDDLPPEDPSYPATSTFLDRVLDELDSTSAATAVGMLYGVPSTWWTTYPKTETHELELAGSVQAWIYSSQANGVGGWARHLNSPSADGRDSWLNWQAYVMGDDRISYDGPQRKFPGAFGPDRTNVFYYDHAYTRPLPDQVSAQTSFNYYNEFFDTLASHPYVIETYVPNFYLVNSVRHNGENFAYQDLYQDALSTNPDNSDFSLESVGFVKDLLQDVCGPLTDANAADVFGNSSNATEITNYLIPCTVQAPNSVLSRFTRKDFASTEATASLHAFRDVNRHIGIPLTMLQGGANSDLKDINGHDQQYPYYLRVSLEADGSSLVDDDFWSDFFLCEVMRANINNFSNANDPGHYILGVGNIYNEHHVAVKIEDSTAAPEVKPTYYGFNGVTQTIGNWASNADALEPYSLRAIDLKYSLSNMFAGLSNHDYGFDRQAYSGFVGQTQQKRIAGGQGIVVGKMILDATTDTLPAIVQLANLHNDIESTEFHERLVEFSEDLNQHFRNFANMIGGTFATRDTVAYKIDKHTVTGGAPSAEPIQSIYFANSEGVHDYIDTQVFFGKKYTYKLYAYDLVIGNQYKYHTPQVYPPIGLAYPNALITQLDGPFGSSASERGLEEDWALTDRPYLSDSLYHQEEYFSSVWVAVNNPNPPASNDAIFWLDDQIMPGITLADGLSTTEILEVGGYPAYADIRIDGFPMTAPLPPLIANTTTARWYVREEDYAQDLENTINSLIQDYINNHPEVPSNQSYRSRVRVRSILNLSGNAQIFIAQVGWLHEHPDEVAHIIWDIQGHSPTSLLPEDRLVFEPFSMAAFRDYFNLQDETNSILGGPALPLILQFQTGQHGTEPIIPWNTADAGTAEAVVDNYKSIKIIEVPLGQSNTVQVTDLPPQFPDIEIYPLKGSNRDIKILLSNNFTKASYMPIIIEPEDAAVFADVRLAQGVGDAEPILFSSDDITAQYQVFRTTTVPTSYDDFAGKLHLTRNARTPANKVVSSVSLLDKVDPNTAYYYCFRTIDKNGYLSNPTPVLKVEMVDDNGRVYPIIEPHQFSPSDPRPTERGFKRYIEIDTSLVEQQIQLADSTQDSAGSPLEAPQNISIGSAAGVFDSETTYKVRLISKDTGRKVDLNLNFNVETIPNPKIPGN